MNNMEQMVNKCGFNNYLLKDSMFEVVLMLVSRLFQAAGPATLTAQSSFVFSVRLRMFSNPCNVDADLNAARFSPTATRVHRSVRYSGQCRGAP